MRWGSLLTALALVSLPAYAAQVVEIQDGDSITVKDGLERVRLRLDCIDAPELNQYPHGIEARQYLANLLPLGTEITYEIKSTDHFGRKLAEVLKGGENVNQKMVISGNAFASKERQRNCHYKTYEILEDVARNLKIGVWDVPGGVKRPWILRGSKNKTEPDN